MGTAAGNFLANLVIESLRTIDNRVGPNYEQVLRYACSNFSPPYSEKWFSDEFYRRGRDASWLASLLVSDADMEGYSGGRLAQYSATIADPNLSVSMFRHARDEAKHSRMFGLILFQTFPDLKNNSLKEQLEKYVPNLTELIDLKKTESAPSPSNEELVNSFLLINLFEIKALVLGKLLKPLVLAHAPSENAENLSKIIDTILKDECRHIKYTADFIEKTCEFGQIDQIRSSMAEFQETLGKVTVSELDKDFGGAENQISGPG